MERYVYAALDRPDVRTRILSGISGLLVQTSDEATFYSYVRNLASAGAGRIGILRWTLARGLEYVVGATSWRLVRLANNRQIALSHLDAMNIIRDPVVNAEIVAIDEEGRDESWGSLYDIERGVVKDKGQRERRMTILYMPDYHNMWNQVQELRSLKDTVLSLEERAVQSKVIVSFPVGTTVPAELASLFFLDNFESPDYEEFKSLILYWLMTQAEQFNDSLRDQFQSRNGFRINEVPREQLNAIHDYLDSCKCQLDQDGAPIWNTENIQECIEDLAEAASGLTWQEAKSALTISYQELEFLSPTDVQKQKITFLNSHPALTIHHPDNLPSFEDVGGYDVVRDYLRKHMSVYLPQNKEMVKNLGLGRNAVKGCLFLGIPGNGKSLVARAVAKEFGMLSCDFDLGAVMDKFVGGSEANIRRAIEMMEKAAGDRGLVVVIDEMEKQLAGMSNAGASDAGASARVHRTLLSWLQDRKRPVIIFMTANNIDQVPPEFLRPGRVDTIWFFDLPDAKERESILNVHLNKYPNIPTTIDRSETSDKLLQGFTGAEIEQLVKECALSVFQDHSEGNTESTIDENLVQSIRAEFKLQCDTHAAAINQLRDRAKSFRKANNRSASASADKPLVPRAGKGLRRWEPTAKVASSVEKEEEQQEEA